MITILSIASFTGLFASLFFLIRILFSSGRRSVMVGKAFLCFFGALIGITVIGQSVQNELSVATATIQEVDIQAVEPQELSSSDGGLTCEADYRQCVDEWDFKRNSRLYFVGREACKAAADQEARRHADDGYRGMTGTIRFGPDPYEKLSYYDWPGMMADDGIVMKDEEVQIQVYKSAWAEGRSVCSFDFRTESVDMITVGFD